jgi:hypothetical protein
VNIFLHPFLANPALEMKYRFHQKSQQQLARLYNIVSHFITRMKHEKYSQIYYISTTNNNKQNNDSDTPYYHRHTISDKEQTIKNIVGSQLE